MPGCQGPDSEDAGEPDVPTGPMPGAETGAETGGFVGSTDTGGGGTSTFGAVTVGTGGVGGGGGSLGGGGVGGGGGSRGGGGGGGSGTGGAGGIVTVVSVTVGIGGTWPMLVPVHAPSRPRTRNTGRPKERGNFRIYLYNAVGQLTVSGVSRMHENTEAGGDLYEILGVARDAEDEVIKQAYRSLARRHHPDVSGDAEADERFREATAAYAVLADPTSRGLYDRLGWRGKGSALTPRRGMARVYASNPRAFLEDLESVISTALGRRPAKQPTRVVGEIELDPYEAHVGATRSVPLGAPEPCAACTGTGRRKVVSHAEAARFVSVEECPKCRGTGEGKTAEPVEVTVPPRARDLDRLKVGPEEVAIVRIIPTRERVGVRVAATAGLLGALGFLLFLLAL